MTNMSLKDQMPLVQSNENIRTPSIQGTLQREGGDHSSNKIEPFVAYRDPKVAKHEDGDGEWSEHTYDSDEERHTRNVFFSFLGLLLCCGLIVASIIILYMASVGDMKATTIRNSFDKIMNKDINADKEGGYDF